MADLFIEKMGTLTLEGGVTVKIVNVDGAGIRLFIDRPLAYCGEAIVFYGDEEAEQQDATAPVSRVFWRKGGPPMAPRKAIRAKRRESITGMGMMD